MASKFGLSEWAKVAEIVGGVAIIASLVFVGIELRHTTAQLMLNSDIDADMSNAALSIRIAENEELSALVYRGEREPESLSDEEMERFVNIALPRLGMWENTYDMFFAGNMSQADWDAWDVFFRLRWNRPGYSYVYSKYRAGFGMRSDPYFSEVFGLPERE